MALVALQCCICGDNIDEDAHKLDPCYIQINTNLTGDKEEQLEQAFFCHFECFKGAMNNGDYLNLEYQDAYVAQEYLKSGKYKQAIDLFEKLLPETTDPEEQQPIMIGMIRCYKQLNDDTRQQEYLKRGLELCERVNESADIFFEAAASAYVAEDYELSSDYLDKYKIAYQAEYSEEDEERVVNDIKYIGALLALHLACGRLEEARSICTSWLDEMSDYMPNNVDEYNASQNIDACIQYLKDPELMFRFADSTFLRSSAPSLEFAMRGLAERMIGDHEKVYQEFLKYKQVFKEQVEMQGDDFEEVWDEMKSLSQHVHDFGIPDDDPILSVLVDDYLQKYGNRK